jgi:hypothetical protein
MLFLLPLFQTSLFELSMCFDFAQVMSTPLDYLRGTYADLAKLLVVEGGNWDGVEWSDVSSMRVADMQDLATSQGFAIISKLRQRLTIIQDESNEGYSTGRLLFLSLCFQSLSSSTLSAGKFQIVSVYIRFGLFQRHFRDQLERTVLAYLAPLV